MSKFKLNNDVINIDDHIINIILPHIHMHFPSDFSKITEHIGPVDDYMDNVYSKYVNTMFIISIRVKSISNFL